MKRSVVFLLVSASVLWSTCAPASPVPASDDRAPQREQRAARTLVMALRNEPEALTTSTGFGSNFGAPARIFTAGVAYKDKQGVPHPYLLDSLPQLNTDSWQIFPDGRMEATYRLRSGLTWHDGAPFTADDVVFSWQVYSSPELGFSRRAPQAQMEEIVARDDRAFVIRWSRPFHHAATLMNSGEFDFAPLPRHLLERPFQEQAPDAFISNSYWTREYISLGPFRVARWEAGAFLEGAAFDGHALGRPKIERIRLVFIQDANAVLANLLAGEVHITDESPLAFTHGLTLRNEWAGRDAGRVLSTPSLLRYAGVQFRPDVVNPRALADLRVRKAIAHGIDKEDFNQGMFEGEGMVADSLIVPTLGYYAEIDRAITKYPYDPRRVEQLMNDAGFTRGTDGIFVSPTQGRFTTENRLSAGVNNEQEGAILAASLQRVGIDLQTSLFNSSLLLDGQFRASYTALDSSGAGSDESNAVHSLSSGFIPRPDNRWTGQNRGGWSNEAYDRLSEAYDTTVDRNERNRLVVQMMKIASDELPWIPFYFNLRVVAYVAAVVGPDNRAPDTTMFWNVHEWELR